MHTFKLPDRRLRVAFFGTPDLAATVLGGLIEANDDDVALVVCQPDRPKGRGRGTSSPPVKALALTHGLTVRQPKRLKDGALADELLSLQVDLSVVVAYGRILPPDLFRAPPYETVNVHASLLPRHRGASPIQHAILSGDPRTGVTLMKLSEGMDEGDMLHTRAIDIPPDATGGSLFDTLAALGRDALIEGLRLAKQEGLTVTPQDAAAATYAPLLSKSDGALDFAQPASRLADRIRALHPWPGTFISSPRGPLKVLSARVVEGEGTAGARLDDPTRLVVATSEGALELVTVQPPGKRPMSGADYLRGQGRIWSVHEPFPG